MTIDDHQTLVDEVVRFAESGPLLQPAGLIVGERMRVIDSFAVAREYAYHRYLTDAEDALNWTDLRERAVGEIHAVTYLDPGLKPLRDRSREIHEQLGALVSRIPPAYAEIADDVIADLTHCAYSRAVFGAANRLFDQIWDGYRQGGWPCGWIGDYPDGELVVLRPPSMQ